MSVQLRLFFDWVRATDEHAGRRLALLEEAKRLLEGGDAAAFDAHHAMALRLERWRYQLLNQHSGQLSPRDQQLADALDLTANELAGRAQRLPRGPRAALAETGLDTGGIAEARSCLEPKIPLDELTDLAAQLTLQHFRNDVRSVLPGTVAEGKYAASDARWRMRLYAPVYLSSHCINHCVYCGFRHPNDMPRKHLSLEHALREAKILMGRGFRHILLVAGDFPRLTTTGYFAEILARLAARGAIPAIEIAPQSTESYAAMVAAGARGVTLYQETYNAELYRTYHPRGSKVAFDWRLEGLDRAADVGVERLGLGILLGLADSREDLVALMRHGRYLQVRFPGRTLAFSLPRIHDAPVGFKIRFPVDDETLIRLYCALRIAFPDAELVLSTRESPSLRNRLARICITQMSAGSSTVPGGYEEPAGDDQPGGQFPISDHRPPDEVAAWLEQEGFQVSWT